MSQDFWAQLRPAFLALAPMDGVTDAAFRHMAAKYGKPAYTVTEFTSVEGIRAGALRLMDDLRYDAVLEKPVVAQLFGADPAAFYPAAAIVSALGFDGIDINMGCPAKNITQHGAGAALILDPPRAREIARQVYAGNKAWADGATLEELGVHPAVIAYVTEQQAGLPAERLRRDILPVSIKTRLGFSEPTVESWIPELLAESPRTITLHGRTLKQGYAGSADWEAIARAARLIKATSTLAVGNGDIQSKEQSTDYCQRYGVDGTLIGRASFGNPWIFQDYEPSRAERLNAALEHARYLDAIIGTAGYVRVRKHLLDYAQGFDGAKELRKELMTVMTLSDVEAILVPLT